MKISRSQNVLSHWQHYEKICTNLRSSLRLLHQLLFIIMNNGVLVSTNANIPTVYSLSFRYQRRVQWPRIRSVVTSKAIEQFLILESMVVAHYGVERQY